MTHQQRLQLEQEKEAALALIRVSEIVNMNADELAIIDTLRAKVKEIDVQLNEQSQ
jgi:hypothetical protein